MQLLPVGGVLPRRLRVVPVEVRAVGEHAGVLVPQVVRVGHQRDDGHRVVGGNKVGLRLDLRALQAGLIGARADDRRLRDGDGAGVDGGLLRGIGAVRRVVDGRALRHLDLDLDGALVQAAARDEHGRLGKAGESAQVRLAGRGRAVIKKAALADRSAVGYVAVQRGHDELVDQRAVRRGEQHRLAADAEVEVGVVYRIGLHADVGRLTVDEEVAARGDGHIREEPLARLLHVVGQAVTLQVDGLSAGVVDFNVVVCALHAGQGGLAVGGHDLRDEQAQRVGRGEALIHDQRALLRVGKARRRLCIGGEAARAVRAAAPGGVGLEQVVRHLVQQPALDVGQQHRLALGAQLEARVRPAAIRTLAVLAGGEDHVIAAGLDRRALREAELDRTARVVGERVVGQVNRL